MLQSFSIDVRKVTRIVLAIGSWGRDGSDASLDLHPGNDPFVLSTSGCSSSQSFSLIWELF